MSEGTKGVFRLVVGLKLVDTRALEGYENNMATTTIPEIIKDVEKRKMLAAESRQRRLEMPTDGIPEKQMP